MSKQATTAGRLARPILNPTSNPVPSMPIYEYHCEPCAHTFETLVRHQADTAHCPKCGGIDLVKQFSVPAAAHTGQGQNASLPLCESGRSPGPCGPGQCRTGLCSFD